MPETDPTLTTLLDRPPAPDLLAAEPPAPCYLVGGAVRDWLLYGVVSRDWDLAVHGDGRAYAGRLARRLGGRLVEPAGARFALFRVVAGALRIDVWDYQGTSIDDELARRDFTINSIALDLLGAAVYDPLRGRDDLAARLLRANRASSLHDDPLRVLRLVRLELVLAGFRATTETLEAARTAAASLPGVAPERIREELDRILSRRQAPGLGARLSELDLYPRLWRESDGPDGDDHAEESEDGSRGSREPPRLEDLDDWLHRAERAAGRSAAAGQLVALHHAALTLAASRSVETATTAPLLARGWVSRRTARVIDDLLARRHRPSSERRARLFLHDAGEAWPIFAAFDAWRAPLAEEAAWEDSLRRLGTLAASEPERIFDPPPLLRGDEIARQLGLEPGPELGRIVERLRRLQIGGRISTPDAARRWLAGRSADSSPG